MMQRQPGSREMPDAVDVHQDGSTSIDHTAVGLANASSSRSSGGLQVLPHIGKAVLRDFLVRDPAIRFGALFLVGSFALRHGPKRPGLWRRRALLGLACVSQCIGKYEFLRYNDIVEDAFMTTDDSGLKLFYRSASYVVTEKNGPSALQQFAQALYADWYERMEADQWEAAGLIEKKQLKENWKNYIYVLPSSGFESRRLWRLSLLSSMYMAQVPREEMWDQWVAQPAYLSMLENWNMWRVVGAGSEFGQLAAAAAGFARSRMEASVSKFLIKPEGFTRVLLPRTAPNSISGRNAAVIPSRLPRYTSWPLTV